jgi:hypothetical protein
MKSRLDEYNVMNTIVKQWAKLLAQFACKQGANFVDKTFGEANSIESGPGRAIIVPSELCRNSGAYKL